MRGGQAVGLGGFLLAASLFLPLFAHAQASPSACTRGVDARGSGTEPYNFRVIDGRLFAGGSLFNPETHKNSVAKVSRLLAFLKARGVRTIIQLHVPSGGDRESEILAAEVSKSGIALLKNRMTSDLVPDASGTARILEAIDRGAYVHCLWGCDRTGAIIAKYLRIRKGFSGEEAWKAILTGGTHAGPIGGFKKKPAYGNLVLYFWPEVVHENREVCELYHLGFEGETAQSPRGN